ncbi:MAG: hypothetical protein MUW56_07495 [Chryseobacterium sp.]|uniref:hypothetical protein n=1 Tax=Chryseobacterium sp. TaxID=1871047 RepID=UPI0025BEBAA0|nr:hypothetical protein [Chryseobacterium sp.]MCJ7933470.1 hypothetical protein [Chryseobacterium sp.]
MKPQILLIILFLPLIHTNCTSQKKDTKTDNKASINVKQSKIEKIELKEQTRGTDRMTTYTPTSRVASLNGEVTTSAISSEAWQKITTEVNAIDLSKISALESPTTGRFTDRALSSFISITVDGKVYTSSTFDSGTPPKELEGLYREITTGIIKKKTR